VGSEPLRVGPPQQQVREGKDDPARAAKRGMAPARSSAMVEPAWAQVQPASPDAAAAPYWAAHDRLAGTGYLLRQHRAYQQKQQVAAEGRTIMVVGPAGGGTIPVPPSRVEIDDAAAAGQSLTEGLAAAGFLGGIAEYERSQQELVAGFEGQAVNLATTALDQYESFLLQQGERYRSDEVVAELHESLAPYRAAFAAFDVEQQRMEAAKSRVEEAEEIGRRPGSSHIQPDPVDLLEAEESRARAVARRGEAIAVTRRLEAEHPILVEKNLPEERRIDKEGLARADAGGLKTLLDQHVAARLADVRSTRDSLRNDATLIYGMDNVMALALATLDVTPDSVAGELIGERVAALHRDELKVAALVAVLALAFMVATLGTGWFAVGGALGLLAVGGFTLHREQKRYGVAAAAAGSGLVSQEPSPLWLMLSVAGVLLDAAAVAVAVGALRAAALGLEAGGTLDDFRQAVRLLEAQRRIDAKVARSVEAAAAARLAYQVAARDLRVALRGKSFMFAGSLGDPAVFAAAVRMAVAQIRQGIYSLEQFLLEVNAARIEASLAELSGEELVLAKQAYSEAEFLAVIEQRQAAITSTEAELEALRPQWQAAETKRLAEDLPLERQAEAAEDAVWRLKQQARHQTDPERLSALNEQVAAAEARRDALVAAREANEEASISLGEDVNKARVQLAGQRESLRLAQVGMRLQNVDAITARLQSHVDDAVAEVDAAIARFKRDGSVDPAILDAGDMGPVIAAQFPDVERAHLAIARGNAIDALAKRTMGNDPELANLILTGRGGKGPDVILNLTPPGQPPLKRWWDMTTDADWPRHVTKYGADYGEGILLPTGSLPPLPLPAP
jgi:hypothetical protein